MSLSGEEAAPVFIHNVGLSLCANGSIVGSILPIEAKIYLEACVASLTGEGTALDARDLGDRRRRRKKWYTNTSIMALSGGGLGAASLFDIARRPSISPGIVAHGCRGRCSAWRWRRGEAMTATAGETNGEAAAAHASIPNPSPALVMCIVSASMSDAAFSARHQAASMYAASTRCGEDIAPMWKSALSSISLYLARHLS